MSWSKEEIRESLPKTIDGKTTRVSIITDPKGITKSD